MPSASVSPALFLCLATVLAAAPAAPAANAAATPSPLPPAIPAATAHPESWPQLPSAFAADPALEARIKALLKTMTVEEKVGQVVQGDLGSVTPEDVRKYRLGSVLGGGNSDPGGRYNAPAPDWLNMADAYYRASMDTSGGGKAIPVLLGIDAVHGHNNVVGATLFPHNIGLGATDDPDLLRQIARATAVELRATGVDWTFAPTVTVPRDDRWGRTYEGYSEDPGLVSRYATAVVEGLQGKAGSAEFLDATHVIASSKHFIGDGGTTGGKDKGDTAVPETELRDIHGAGHIAAVRAGTQTVMASFSSWNGQKMHGNQSLLTGVLKGRLGFDGFVVGDWDGHAEVPGCTKNDCPAALVAGLDMFMAPESWRAIYESTVREVRAGVIPMARLDDAVTRILRVKFRLGLFDAGLPSQRALGGKFEQLGSEVHRQLARKAVRESLVLLKNNAGLLPLDPKRRVLVAGDGADNVGKQSGGWTLSWQGTGNKPTDFPRADSIWTGIRAASTAAGGSAELSVGGEYTQRPDVAIVVFGEDPYAEFLGDIPNLAFEPGKAGNLALLRKLKAAGIPVVSVFLSGRPLWVNREINASDAFVAAWLPGSEGGGVADVLFKAADGGVAHDFKGKLSFSWPKSAVQSPLNRGQRDYDPQFPFGYGLSYAKPVESGVLPEVSGLADDGAVPGLFFDAGKAASGWSWVANNVDVAPIDHLAQEDARLLHWRAGSASAGLHSGAPLDLSREAQSGLMLVATIKLDAQPSTPVSVGLGCGADCAAQVPLQPVLAKLPAGQWTRVGIPLSCFAQAGADLSKVTNLFELAGNAPLDVGVSKVALSTQADHTVSCPAH